MKIYNLFPLLAGPLKDWKPHMERAASMGFDWLFINPIQKPGSSGSLYSIQDYFQINPFLLAPRSKTTPEQQVRKTLETAEKLGLRAMADLVINHCAFDSPLLKEHPDWFVKENGKITHPSCTHDGQDVVWGDLARFDPAHTRDAEGFFRYCLKIVEYLAELGFKGLRCDAAYQIPSSFWQRLIHETRRKYPEMMFFAETLGCSPEQTKETARAGFDFIFNSSKWWDFESPWLLEQYLLTRETVPSVSFAESHDTPRLAAEVHSNVEAMQQRYFFSALFSAGMMMPMGFEFGFRKPLHVVNSRPDDWEITGIDLTEYIRHINQIKTRYPVFNEESVTEILWHDSNPAILLLWKAATRGKGQALLLLNKDPWNRQYFRVENLSRYIQGAGPLSDLSPQWPLDYLPAPFEFEFTPGMGRVLVAP